MAQDTDLLPPGALTRSAPAAPGPAAPPVFGRRPGALADRTYRTFSLEIEGKRSARARKEERWDETFTCFTDVDGGMWVSMGNARTELAIAQALVRFLGTNLRDDDGASMDYTWPTEPERADPDDPDSDWLRADPTDDDPDGPPLWPGWDGELYLHEDLPTLHELRDGSSRRRFAFISDSMHMRYRLEALQEVADWLTEGITGRPTARPLPSGHGPQRTARGSGARRR